MKIVLTGSLGHIGRPLTQLLAQKGHQVTVISSKTERKKDIEALGATAAIGSVEDVPFLTATFTGADAVYTMLPLDNYFDPAFDIAAYTARVGNHYMQAIRQSGVKRVVHLSSIGAHLEKGSGLIALHHQAERTLDQLADVAITFMRPVGFYYNLYAFVQPIKNYGAIASNYGGADKMLWVAPADIAAAIAEEIVQPLAGRKIVYVASDELTCNETARILGAAIGMPDLKWNIITEDEMRNGMIAAGMVPAIASGLAEMNTAIHSGLLLEDYYRNKPVVMGKIKMAEFAKEFAAAFQPEMSKL